MTEIEDNDENRLSLYQFYEARAQFSVALLLAILTFVISVELSIYLTIDWDITLGCDKVIIWISMMILTIFVFGDRKRHIVKNNKISNGYLNGDWNGTKGNIKIKPTVNFLEAINKEWKNNLKSFDVMLFLFAVVLFIIPFLIRGVDLLTSCCT